MSELIPRQLMQQFVEDHGRDTAKWPSELQDLLNPNIQARQMSAPISGQIEKFLNTEFAYTWAKDLCGQNPDHSRVEELRYDGWEYATTDDVIMCTEDTVKGRNPDKKSKDGKGFSNEIRSGDRRLMKVPIMRRREQRKAQNLAAMQMAYPQPYGGDGRPMTLEQFTPGMNTRFATEAEVSAIKQSSQRVI